MNADHADRPDDDSFASLLTAYEQALRGEKPAPEAGAVSEPMRQRLDRALHCIRTLQQLWPASPQPAPAPSETRYQRTGIHAVGGIGCVWVAHDTRLHRDIALKELRQERLGDAALQERFLREALITCQLQHPGIAPVYDLVEGDNGQPPSYTMRLVKGRTLTEAVHAYHHRRGGAAHDPLSLRGFLDAFVRVCSTIAYAHARGVIHRDLKGQNVVLGDFGEVIVVDWGFARWLRSEPQDPTSKEVANPPGAVTDTLSGQILGTPAYMAPEQAEGRAARVDQRTDVYGLGAILFEILTGRPPNAGDDAEDIVNRLRAGEACPSARFDAAVPAALAAIGRKALARRPEDRYTSASDLAEDVQRWLADEPVRAYAEPVQARLRRWARRHRTAVAGVAALAVTSLLAVIVTVILLGKERAEFAEHRAHAAAEQSERDARARTALERELYSQRLARAERELAAHSQRRALELLAACPPEQRQWEWFCLQRLCHRQQTVLRGHTATITDIAFHPDGHRLFSAGHDHTIRIWDVQTGALLQTLGDHTDAIQSVNLSPDGRLLASCGLDRTVRVWDADSGRLLHTLTDFRHAVSRVAFAPDHQTLVSQCGNEVSFWNARSGEKIRTQKFETHLSGLVLQPDGRRFVTIHPDYTLRFWDTTNGEPSLVLRGHTSVPRRVAFSPDGKRLASGDGEALRSDTGVVKIWDTTTGAELMTLTGHTDAIAGVAFHPRSQRLVSASHDGTIKVWDLAEGREVVTLRGQGAFANAVRFSADGRFLASALADHTILIWDAAPWNDDREPEEIYARTVAGERVFAVTYGPDGKRVATMSERTRLRLRAAESGEELASARLSENPGEALALACSPDSKNLASGVGSGRIYVLDAASGKEVFSLTGHGGGPIKGLAFSADGQWLASASWDRSARLWDWRSKKLLRTLTGHTDAVVAVAFSPDGETLATGSYDQSIKVWNARTGEELRTLGGQVSRVEAVAYCPTAPLLASAGGDARVTLWDTRTWQPLRQLRGHSDNVCSLAFSPAGHLLATGSDDWTVTLWDYNSGKQLRSLRGHTAKVRGVSFSPDGRRLVSVSHDGSVRLWDLSRFCD
jgi:WD40 repeat protein/tRNA A-37 threonylcarbamoyl transferase component Bud32